MAKALLEGEFIIGDTGEQFIVARWHPDPKKIEQDLIKMAQGFADWSTPLQETKQLMIEDTKLHFVQERDPFGRKWIPLNTTYALDKQKAVGDKPILQYTGALEKAATSETSWLTTNDAVIFNADALPKKTSGKTGKVSNYGAVHQTGSGAKNISGFERIFRSIPFEQLEDFLKKLTPDQRRQFKEYSSLLGSGKNLVQRMFIGASEETIAKIELVFIDFLRGTVEDPWMSLGMHFGFVPGRAYGGGQMIRGPHRGQFEESFQGF